MSSLLQKSGKILHHPDYEKKYIFHTTNASKNIFFFEEMIQETKNKGQLCITCKDFTVLIIIVSWKERKKNVLKSLNSS